MRHYFPALVVALTFAYSCGHGFIILPCSASPQPAKQASQATSSKATKAVPGKTAKASPAKAEKARDEPRPCAFTMPPLATDAEKKSAKSMLGRFKGNCQTGTKQTFPVETELVSLADGWMSGSYVMHLQGEYQKGTLTVSSIKGHHAVFNWQDQYGAGKLVVTFSKDFGDFTGTWKNYEGVGGTWNGKRESSGAADAAETLGK